MPPYGLCDQIMIAEIRESDFGQRSLFMHRLWAVWNNFNKFLNNWIPIYIFIVLSLMTGICAQNPQFCFPMLVSCLLVSSFRSTSASWYQV